MSARAKRAAAPPLPPLADRQRPGLSETLIGPKDPRVCQSCATPNHPGNPLARWLEHDPNDTLPPKPVVVVLCARCSGRLIEPHPRLYRPVDNGAPFPGCMGVCVTCRFRDGVACTNPLAKLNGGPGLAMTWEKPPVSAHLCYGGGRSEFKTIFSGPVKSCSGREVRA